MHFVCVCVCVYKMHFEAEFPAQHTVGCPSPSRGPLTCPQGSACRRQPGAAHCCSPVWPACPCVSPSAPTGHSSCGGHRGTPAHPSLQEECGCSQTRPKQPRGHLRPPGIWRGGSDPSPTPIFSGRGGVRIVSPPAPPCRTGIRRGLGPPCSLPAV